MLSLVVLDPSRRCLIHCMPSGLLLIRENLVLTRLFNVKPLLWKRKDTTTWLGEWVEKLWQPHVHCGHDAIWICSGIHFNCSLARKLSNSQQWVLRRFVWNINVATLYLLFTRRLLESYADASNRAGLLFSWIDIASVQRQSTDHNETIVCRWKTQ